MSYFSFPSVQNIIDGVAQDVRQQLQSTTNSAGQPILIDYTNRVHKQMLRFSNWKFLNSDFLFFPTAQGQSKYWIGPAATCPAGYVDTGLHLNDVARLEQDSVVDVSNDRGLKWLSAPPIGPQLNDRLGMGRPGLPSNFTNDPNNPNVIGIYPPPNNQNLSTPNPEVPFATTTPGGALANRFYYIKVTIVDSAGNESNSTANGREQFIPANNLVQVVTPTLTYPISGTGVLYNQYNVYAATTEGSETLQNVSPIAIGTNWTEPTSGLTTTGASVPTTNNLTPFNAYLIKFRYYKNRLNLANTNDVLQIPDDYKDVVINGVKVYAYHLLGRREDAQAALQAYKSGLTEMIWDKNQFPGGQNFIRPDGGSYVNQQLMNIWPPFF
jgi:hypothetical protein